MPHCAIATCKSLFIHNKKRQRDERLSFFTFPKNEELAKVWWIKCKRKDKKSHSESDRVCSLHFHPKDFVKSLPELYGLPCLKRKLAADAIPSLHLPKASSSKSVRRRTTFTSKR